MWGEERVEVRGEERERCVKEGKATRIRKIKKEDKKEEVWNKGGGREKERGRDAVERRRKE